ncbi:MAG: 50S ribosomal protein L25 [Parcubacteria group bacterium CG_4_9_14_0_2_um_filter_41_8]|nr:MAG: hypothetical protein AUJ34_00115 [Parcubacteria group bacterium CG1_02_41_12]PIP66797.1 MAG: 50S ribosomal protein L25 [Parcubacteria group bacterium CG22_combo_CG10-13_8_21_14_all_41_9]PIQ79154.1 MAG: 50S ribosomal protein L25 [Parcubacteria group bacterium CG11_big_fil_rev_8_21_14_0_20_41_14]PIR56765.1 MAG: 50S ribosomal protein L25 [Parcubacteria group bacterium CG10_big_fil_rev_8_21_14_0_10_41_35]PIZ80937.1 MAG: 50S ribosomal protein L25 [Parcubacteria group bacterium CG_4_10_14_0_2
MANIFELKLREDFGKVAAKRSRSNGLIPGVVYGDQIKSRHFALDPRDIDKMKKASQKGTGLLDVLFAGEKDPVKVVIQNIETHSVKGVYEHIDLYQVRMDRELNTEAALEFSGSSKAVRDLGGILVKQHDKLPISCLPSALISHVEVNIDSLNTFEDVIRVKDLKLPEGVVTSLSADEIVAAVTEPRSEAELEELNKEVEVDVDKIEVTGEKKEEPEEGSEAAEEKPEKKKE